MNQAGAKDGDVPDRLSPHDPDATGHVNNP